MAQRFWKERLPLKLILGSGSPRRRDILDLFDLDYDIEVSSVEESISTNFSPKINAMYNAYIKGSDIKSNKPNCLVISADTIVQIDGEILGKPKDSTDALNMLKMLSGKKHSVITGFSIISDTKKYIDYVETEVIFKNLNDIMIKKYIDSKEPFDKAGAYGIQGKGSLLVDKIIGDYFNVVGLPISKIAEALKELFDFDIF